MDTVDIFELFVNILYLSSILLLVYYNNFSKSVIMSLTKLYVGGGIFLADLGSAIRFMRKNQKLSLKDVAEKTELTISHLSQIERNLASPSLITLEKIASALGYPISSFFVNPQFTSTHIPAEAQRTIQINPGMTLRFLINNVGQRNQLGAYIAEVADLSEEIIIHHGTKLIYVLEGEMHFNVAQKEFYLTEGDSLFFNGNVPHWISRKSKSKLKLFVATTPPEIF
ncbi:hypothetical protein SDC9_35730 [bioreactor metagenome]|uniref:HTH cro/C1-type domain-containing protein n=1 Tax=bioreactor metagenome TaxID=1076179 RepID=A0A644VEE6_9ZZZZ|nr:helix-turn-helix domain-containing protein [Desulfitobacterium hafniense]